MRLLIITLKMYVLLLAAAALHRMTETESRNQRSVLLVPSAVLFTGESTHTSIVTLIRISWMIKEGCQGRLRPNTRRSWILHKIVSEVLLDLDSV